MFAGALVPAYVLTSIQMTGNGVILYRFVLIIASIYVFIKINELHLAVYTGCSLTHGTNFDSLYKNPIVALFQE